jgi:hypothetical protein
MLKRRAIAAQRLAATILVLSAPSAIAFCTVQERRSPQQCSLSFVPSTDQISCDEGALLDLLGSAELEDSPDEQCVAGLAQCAVYGDTGDTRTAGAAAAAARSGPGK